MSSLVSISKLDDPAVLAEHKIDSLPVAVIFPHNQCNCRCVMCDIWRIREAQQITPADLDRHLESFKQLGVRWVVFSGGEPQLNEKWSWLAQMLRSMGSRVTLLTAGLLLKSQAQAVVDSVDDVIVSLDGPPAVHDAIRRIPDAFRQWPRASSAASTESRFAGASALYVQKAIIVPLRGSGVRQQIGSASVSFLAADLTSSRFQSTRRMASRPGKPHCTHAGRDEATRAGNGTTIGERARLELDL